MYSIFVKIAPQLVKGVRSLMLGDQMREYVAEKPRPAVGDRQ